MVAERPPFGKELFDRLIVCSLCTTRVLMEHFEEPRRCTSDTERLWFFSATVKGGGGGGIA